MRLFNLLATKDEKLFVGLCKINLYSIKTIFEFSFRRLSLVKLAKAAAASVTAAACLMVETAVRVPVRSISFSMSAGRMEESASSASSKAVTTSATSIPDRARGLTKRGYSKVKIYFTSTWTDFDSANQFEYYKITPKHKKLYTVSMLRCDCSY